MINIKNFDSVLLKIDKKLHKNIDIYYIGYITIKDLDYLNIHNVNRVNPLYLFFVFFFVFDKLDGYIEESNENK